MKQLLTICFFAAVTLVSVNCSSGNENVEPANDFANTEYIKSQMIGKWNYWGHLSPTTGTWWYSGDVYKWYFEFKGNGTYSCKDLSSEIQNGTYTILPATKTDNPVLYLNYKEGTKDKSRKIILKKLEGKSAVIYESSFEERYDKE